MIQALRKGEIDAVYEINANDYNSLASAKGITRIKGAGGGFDVPRVQHRRRDHRQPAGRQRHPGR